MSRLIQNENNIIIIQSSLYFIEKNIINKKRLYFNY